MVVRSRTAEYGAAVAEEEEEMGRIRRLQNGSDVRGVAVEGEKGREVDLTPAAVEAIVESFGEWVVEGESGRRVERVRVSLGRDPRISGGCLSSAVFAGLSRAGCLVFDMGLATTPACFMSTVLPPFSYDASIMVRTIFIIFFFGGIYLLFVIAKFNFAFFLSSCNQSTFRHVAPALLSLKETNVSAKYLTTINAK